jgi:hypothetical protein
VDLRERVRFGSLTETGGGSVLKLGFLHFCLVFWEDDGKPVCLRTVMRGFGLCFVSKI